MKNTENPLKNALKTSLVCLLLCTTGLMAKAQNQPIEFAPVGSIWHYDYIVYLPDLEFFISFSLNYESTASFDWQDMKLKKIEEYYDDTNSEIYNSLGNWLPVQGTVVHYIYQDTERIYEMNVVFSDTDTLVSTKNLLFDFSKKAGEYWVTCEGGDTIFVLSNDSIELLTGEIRKKTTIANFTKFLGRDMHQTPSGYGDISIVEGFGFCQNSQELSLPVAPDMSWLERDQQGKEIGYLFYLRCYFQNDVFVYDNAEFGNHTGSLCGQAYFGPGVKDIDKVKIVFVNPIADNFTVSVSNEEQFQVQSIQVYSITGQLIKEVENVFSSNVSVPFASYGKGVYIIKINFDNNTSQVVKGVRL